MQNQAKKLISIKNIQFHFKKQNEKVHLHISVALLHL